MVKQAGRKTGSFANAFRPPPGHGKISVDWDAVMRNHVPAEEAAQPIPEKQQLTLEELDRVNRGVQNYYTDEQRANRPKKTPGRRGPGRQVPFDVDEVVRLYTEDHLTPTEIKEKLGVSSERTIIKYLKLREVFEKMKYRPGGSHDRTKPPVRPADSYVRQTECGRGHDLTVEGATYDVFKYRGNKVVKNGRACKACRALFAARERRACLECSHAAIKHNTECEVRDCGCKIGHLAIKAAWAELGEKS